MYSRLSLLLIASSIASTGLLGCSGEATNPAEIVRLRTATATECADGGQTILVGLDGNGDGMLEGDEIISTSAVCNGSIGETGPQGGVGVDGTNALIVTTAEAAGANCAGGGVRLDVGIDDDSDGNLGTAEIDATSYICNGADGADGVDGLNSLTRTSTTGVNGCGNSGGVTIESGLDADANGVLDNGEVTQTNAVCNGNDGANSLVEVNVEAPGANCGAGGQQIVSGVDDDGDGALTGIEIADTSYICDPINNLVNVSAELAGSSTICANGGSRVDVGLDTNANGSLDASEISQTSYSCNGADGANGTNGSDGGSSLVIVTPEAAGNNCVNGGQQIRAGADANTNGTLEPGEVASTTYVCDGADGLNGVDGAAGVDGASGSLARVSVEAAGANCLNGGSRIESGPDVNLNGVLDGNEITATAYACDGAARESLVTSTSIASGPDCATGGFRVESGLDTNGNGMLEGGEITSTSFVCNGLAAVPFAIQTAVLPDGVAGQPYSATLTAAGGTGGSYAWSVSMGNLPPGVTVSPTGTPDATLSGLPTGGGNYTFTIAVTDFFGQSASRQYSIVVAGPVLEITTYVAPQLDVGQNYSFTLGAAGGSAPYTWSIAQGTLPAGLTLNADVISGTPSVNIQTDTLVRVTDAGGATRDARIVFPSRRDWVGFSGDLTTDAVSEFFVVNISSGTPGAAVAINPAVVPSGGLGQTTVPTYLDVKFSVSGDKVAFVGDLALDGAEEMWFVDLSGAVPGAPVKANPDFTTLDQDVDADDYGFSADGRWLAYVADQVLNSEFNLFVVDTTVTPAASVQVNGALPLNGDVDTSDGFAFSPDSTKLAYISDETTSAVETLWVVDLTVQPFVPQQVSSGAASADIYQLTWSPDSTLLIFAGDDITDSVTEIFMSDVSSGSPAARVRLNAPLTNASGDVGTSVSFDSPSDYRVSPDGTKIYYIADARTEGVDELYVVDIANPGVARLVSQDGRTNTGDDVDRAFWTPDSQSLVFVGDTETTAILEVFLADATGTGAAAPVALNAPFVTGGDVSQGSSNFSTDEVVVDPQGRGVFFMADGLLGGEEELYFSAFTAPGTMINLSPNIAGTSDVNSFLVSKGGSLVVYSGDPTGSAIDEVYAVDASNGTTFGAPQVVNGTLVTSGDVDTGASSTSRDYDIVGEGIGVIYIADELVDGQDEPFFTPITAGVVGSSASLMTPVTLGDTYQVYR